MLKSELDSKETYLKTKVIKLRKFDNINLKGLVDFHSCSSENSPLAGNKSIRFNTPKQPTMKILKDLSLIINKSKIIKKLTDTDFESLYHKTNLKSTSIQTPLCKEEKSPMPDISLNEDDEGLTPNKYLSKQNSIKTKRLKIFPGIRKFSESKRNSPVGYYNKNNVISPRDILYHQNSFKGCNSTESFKDDSQDLLNLPFLFAASGKNNSSSPKKYYKDKPILSKNFRVPKDVFVVKS